MSKVKVAPLRQDWGQCKVTDTVRSMRAACRMLPALPAGVLDCSVLRLFRPRHNLHLNIGQCDH